MWEVSVEVKSRIINPPGLAAPIAEKLIFGVSSISHQSGDIISLCGVRYLYRGSY